MFLGFRRQGPLSQNQIRNTPVQGTSFHLLQHSLNRLNAIRKKEKWETKIYGQIHDEIIFSLAPSEEEHVIETVEHIMTNPGFDFINVPLAVEFSMGKNWQKMEDV